MERRSDFVSIPDQYDYLAPDGSEIRLLSQVPGGEIAHCSLPVQSTSFAMVHKSVHEIWHFLDGEGELWRKEGDKESVTLVQKGSSINLLKGVSFQFRNIGSIPLTFLVVTVPKWPGPSEALPVAGFW